MNGSRKMELLRKVPYCVRVKNIRHTCLSDGRVFQAVSVDLIKDIVVPYSCGLF